MRPTVYLAGPIRGLTVTESKDWRDEFAQQLRASGLEAWSPMRAKPWLKDINGPIIDAYPEFTLGSGRGILTRDIDHDVRLCDLVLANLCGADTVSVGTVLEVGAAYAWRKPIVLILARDKQNPHNHAMLLETTPFVVPDLTTALQIIKGILLP